MDADAHAALAERAYEFTAAGHRRDRQPRAIASNTYGLVIDATAPDAPVSPP